MFPKCVRKSSLVFGGVYSVLRNPKVFALTEHRTRVFSAPLGLSSVEPGQIRGNLQEESDVAHFPSQAQGDHLPQTSGVCYGPFNQVVLFMSSAWLSHAPNEMTCDTHFAKPVPYEEP